MALVNNTYLILALVVCLVVWLFTNISVSKSEKAQRRFSRDMEQRASRYLKYRCHSTKSVVTSDKEYQNRDDCLESSGVDSCRLLDNLNTHNMSESKQTARLEAEQAVNAAKKDCEELMPRRVVGVQEDCEYVSPCLVES